jgi:hypothetical protein
MDKMSKLAIYGVLILGVACLGLSSSGCGDDDTEVSKDKAYLRVLHLSPDAPGVDVYANGTSKVVNNLMFLEGTSYLEVEAGTYDFNITATGSPASQSVLDIDALVLSKDTYYTAVAFDALGSIKAMPLVDDYDGLDSGNIRVRAIHAAEAVGQVDIWVIPETGNPSILYENVDFGVAGDYLDLPAAAYTLGFDLDDDATPDVIFDVPALAAGTIANVFAVNDSNGAVTLQAQVESGSMVQITPRPEKSDSFIRVLHLSPDAPGVDVYVDGAAKVVEDLAFLEGTGYLTVEEGTYDFNITATGTPANQSVLDVTGLALAGDAYYTAVAFDALSSIQAMALVDDYENLDAGNIRIRAIHAAEVVGQVDIWVIPDMGAPSILYENVDFGVAGDYLDLPAAAYTLGFDLDDDATPDVIFDVPSLAAGTVANVFAVNDNMGSVTLQAQLEDGSLVQIDSRT